MADVPPAAVFLSYASQDAAAVQRLAEALRAAGVEVWFDRNELVGGDAWDAKIRRQIAECALFVPVISAATQARREGYFRIEWRLAAQRTHAMSDDTTFLLPVVIDDTRDADARVPAEFKAVQWTRLPGGESPAAFCARVKGLLVGADAPEAAASVLHSVRTKGRPAWRPWGWGGLAAVGLAGVLYFGLKPGAPQSPADALSISPKPVAAPLSEAQKLVAQARKIYDDGDELNRENLLMAEALVQRAIERDPAEASAWELATWLSYTMVWHSIDGSDTRRDQLSQQAARLAALAPESVSAQVVHANARLTPGWAGATVQSTREKAIQEIERNLRGLAQREPDNWQIQRALATAYRFLNRTDESVAAMRRAVALSGGHPTAVGDLINVLIRRGRHAEAETVLASGLARRSTGRLLTFDVLLKTRWRGDPAAAIAAVESEAWPAWLTREDRGAFFAWQAYFWARRAEAALAVVRGVPRDYLRDANFSGPRAVLSARAFERAGQTVAAQADWRLVVQVADRELGLHPDELSALYWKAWALARLGDLDTARTLCALIQERSQGDQPVFLRGTHLAALLATAGLGEAALQDLRTYRTAFTDGYVITRAVLELDPAFDPLRADPRFQEIVRAAPAPAETAAKPAEKSVAVLPFANLGGDKDSELFAQGIHEDVITNLQKIRDLEKVISRTSVLAYTDTSTRNLAGIGADLGVATVVEGSVRKMGTQVKVSAKLLHARTEACLWLEEFSGEASVPFALQAAIAQKIALALKATLTEGERTLIARRPTKSSAAHERFLAARRKHDLLNNRSSRAEHDAVIAAYQHVLAEDPEYAQVHARLAHVHGHMYWLGHLDPTPARRALAQATLREAVRIDPLAPETEFAQGLVAYYCEMDWARAMAHYQRAEAGLPNDAALHGQIGFTHRRLGNWRDCIRSFERALELEPRYLYLASELSAALLDLRQPAAALRLAERFATLYPEDALVANTRARAEFALSGDREKFLAALQRLPRAGQDPSGQRAAYDRAMWAHDFAAAERALADPGLGAVIDGVSILAAPPALHRAMVAYLRGDAEGARSFAAAATALYAGGGAWSRRQEPFVALDLAAAKGYAGRTDEAVREALAAITAVERMDAYASEFARVAAGRLFAVLGRKEEALTILRRLMVGICPRATPHEIRLDPCWSRLKDDPRFEEMLQSAQPL